MATLLTRTPTAALPTLTLHSSSQIVHWDPNLHNTSVREIQRIASAYTRNTPRAQDLITPPYHWHWRQTETFQVKRGSFIFTLEGRDSTVRAGDPEVVIPPGARHTFRADPDCQEEYCKVEITAQPGDSGISERFFRNLYSYLEDCERVGSSPRLPQLLLFMYEAEVSLALPGPRVLANPASWLLSYVVGKWGGWALGYKSSYKEYFDERGGKSS
ncbi:hypothetical protein MMC13_004149 [Lambiella insularis]|nr:hypothetical protein [Lambiella insularis]